MARMDTQKTFMQRLTPTLEQEGYRSIVVKCDLLDGEVVPSGWGEQ